MNIGYLSATQEECLSDLANPLVVKHRGNLATIRALKKKGCIMADCGYRLTHYGTMVLNSIRERRGLPPIQCEHCSEIPAKPFNARILTASDAAAVIK